MVQVDLISCAGYSGVGFPAQEIMRMGQECLDNLTYYYAWKNNPKRATLYKRHCRVVARLRMNSAVVEFENGQRECVSRNALRRLPSSDNVDTGG